MLHVKFKKHLMSRFLFVLRSLGCMLHVDFKKWPCRHAKCKGREPHCRRLGVCGGVSREYRTLGQLQNGCVPSKISNNIITSGICMTHRAISIFPPKENILKSRKEAFARSLTYARQPRMNKAISYPHKVSKYQKHVQKKLCTWKEVLDCALDCRLRSFKPDQTEDRRPYVQRM